MRQPKYLLLLAAAIACGGVRGEAQPSGPRAEVIFPDATRVRVEIANTDATRQRGLMFRESLAQNEGMIFVFTQAGYYPFWMKNCVIALDMLWLDAGGTVLAIQHSVPPCRLPNCTPPCHSDECPTVAPDSRAPALYVVEVASGFAKQHGVKAGDKLVLKGVPQKGR